MADKTMATDTPIAESRPKPLTRSNVEHGSGAAAPAASADASMVGFEDNPRKRTTATFAQAKVQADFDAKLA